MHLRLPFTTLGLALLLPMAAQASVRGSQEDRDLVITVDATKVQPKQAQLPKTLNSRFKDFNGAEQNIVGGNFAGRGEFPWFAAPAKSESEKLCGASLIHNGADSDGAILLTSASCEEQFAVGSTVYIGAYQPNSAGYGAQSRTVAKLIKHPLHNAAKYMNDFMLVVLDSAVTGVTPVVLNAQQATPSLGEDLTVMGFGWVNQQTGVTPALLVKVGLSSVAHNVCQSQYENFILADGSSFTVDQQKMLCAGAVGGGVGPCVGDVGSPLVTAEGVQVGIVSFGIGCGSASYSSIYSRLSGAKSWIDQTVCAESKASAPNCGGGGNTKQILMVMKYDAKPQETSFELKQGSNILYAGPGASNPPGPNEIWHYDFGQLAEGTYELLVKDSACDGQLQLQGTANEFLPRFEVFEDWADTAASSLARGPLNNGLPSFRCQYSLFFSVGDLNQGADERCPNYVGSGLTTDHCTWLTQYNALCSSYDIAVKCPVTCSICQSVVNVDGDDKFGSIEMGPDFGGPGQSCQWLSDQADKAALCKRTRIAFHCQETCNVNSETIKNP